MASLKRRWQAAVEVFRRGYPTRRVGNKGEKSAPFVVWPSYWKDKAQWRMVDLQTYIEEGFNINTLIYSAVMFKARAAIQAPLTAYDGSQERRVPLAQDHPLSKLCARPNESQSWSEFQMLQTIYFNIVGDSITWFDRKNSTLGVPSEMHPISPLRLGIIPGKNGKIKGYWYTPEGKSREDGVPLAVQDVSHVKLPNPNDPLDGEGFGMSPISPLARSGDVDNMITHFLQLFFQRGAVPVGALKFKSALTPETVGAIKERWRELYGGYENWSEIGVLDSEGEYQRIGMTFEELGFEALDERNESRILGPFGVPPILIGSRLGLMRSTYANYKEAREGFWEDTMLSEMKLYGDDYSHYLKSEDGGYVAFDFMQVPALRKDIVNVVQAWRGLVEYGIPKDVAAVIVGIELGKLEDGQVSYMPLNMAPLGANVDMSVEKRIEAGLAWELKRANDLLERER